YSFEAREAAFGNPRFYYFELGPGYFVGDHARAPFKDFEDNVSVAGADFEHKSFRPAGVVDIGLRNLVPVKPYPSLAVEGRYEHPVLDRRGHFRNSGHRQ